MIDLQQLRAFIVLSEEMHFGRAAHRLNMTQPPLTRQIQSLEKSVGVQLLDRTSRSVKLTHAGRLLVREARRLLAGAERLVADVQRAAAGDIGPVRLGFTAGSGYGFLPALLAQVRPKTLGIDLILHEMVSVRQFEALATDQLDAGILRPPIDHAKFASMRLYREDFVVALPRGHGLEGKPGLTPGDLEGEDFIMYSPYEAKYFYDIILNMLHSASARVNIVHYVPQIHSMLALVRSELGVAIVPRSAMIINERSLVFRPLVDAVENSAELFIVWCRDNENPALRRFLDSAATLSVAAPSPRPAQARA